MEATTTLTRGVSAFGDISFCKPEYFRQIVNCIQKHKSTTFYLQSKRPEYFQPFLKELPENVILVTTLETNRNAGYSNISKAPMPSIRYEQFYNLDYPRKVITIEPVMKYDIDIFSQWVLDIKPEYVYFGVNTHPKHITYTEPTELEMISFISKLKLSNIKIIPKELRDFRVLDELCKCL